MAVHPRGEPLLWQDRRGCAHLLSYGYRNWSKDQVLAPALCGGAVSITPNGAAYLWWRTGTPGVAVVREGRRVIEPAATQYTFVAAPVSVPDGRGVIGIVSKGGSRTGLAYERRLHPARASPRSARVPVVRRRGQRGARTCVTRLPLGQGVRRARSLLPRR